MVCSGLCDPINLLFFASTKIISVEGGAADGDHILICTILVAGDNAGHTVVVADPGRTRVFASEDARRALRGVTVEDVVVALAGVFDNGFIAAIADLAALGAEIVARARIV